MNVPLNSSFDGSISGSRPRCLARFTLQTFSGRKLSGPPSIRNVIVFFGHDLAADAAVLFEQQHVNGLAVGLGPGLQMDGSCQAGDTAAYDNDFRHD